MNYSKRRKSSDGEWGTHRSYPDCQHIHSVCPQKAVKFRTIGHLKPANRTSIPTNRLVRGAVRHGTPAFSAFHRCNTSLYRKNRRWRKLSINRKQTQGSVEADGHTCCHHIRNTIFKLGLSTYVSNRNPRAAAIK